MHVCTLTCLVVSQLLLQFLSVLQRAPLHVAAERCRFEKILEYLVKGRADINIQDNKGVNTVQGNYCISSIRRHPRIAPMLTELSPGLFMF